MCGLTEFSLPEPQIIQVPGLMGGFTELTTHGMLSLSCPPEYCKCSTIVCSPNSGLRGGDKQFISFRMAGVMNLEFTGPRNYVQKPMFTHGEQSWTKRA